MPRAGCRGRPIPTSMRTAARQAERNGHRLAELIARAGRLRLRRQPAQADARDHGARAPGDGPRSARLPHRSAPRRGAFRRLAGFHLRRARGRPTGLDRGAPPGQMEFRPPGRTGESYEMLQERVAPWLGELSRPTVCVTHGGVVRAALPAVRRAGPNKRLPPCRCRRTACCGSGTANWTGFKPRQVVWCKGSAAAPLLRQLHVGDQVLAADLVIGQHDVHALLEGVDIELSGQLIVLPVRQRDASADPCRSP